MRSICNRLTLCNKTVRRPHLDLHARIDDPALLVVLEALDEGVRETASSPPPAPPPAPVPHHVKPLHLGSYSRARVCRTEHDRCAASGKEHPPLAKAHIPIFCGLAGKRGHQQDEAPAPLPTLIQGAITCAHFPRLSLATYQICFLLSKPNGSHRLMQNDAIAGHRNQHRCRLQGY